VWVIQGTLGIQECVDVWTLAHLVDLAATDDPLEVLLVAVQGQSFRIAVQSILVVLFREAVAFVPDRVPGDVAQYLYEARSELNLPDRLLGLVGPSCGEMLRVLLLDGAVLVEVRVVILDVDIAVIVHIEERLVRIRVLGLLLTVGLPYVGLALALEAIQLLLVPSGEVVAALTIELVVVVGGLEDRVVLGLHVAVVVHGDILVEGVGRVLVLVRDLVLADRPSDILPSCSVLKQSGILAKLAETALLDGARLATRFLELPFHEVAVLLFDIAVGR
jgi:hypothetical protein